MLRVEEDAVLITQEACDYLRISRPTYLKSVYMGRIKGTKAGKGWRVLKTELERFLKGEGELKHEESLDDIAASDAANNPLHRDRLAQL